MGPPGWQDQTLRPQLQAKEGPRSKDLSRKVLTRHFECINTSCVSFKHNCESYPIVNTGVCSKAPPGGVDRSDELDHHQSHVGWRAFPVCNKLGENNSRLMGLASHKGIPNRTGSTTLANKANASNKLLCRGGGNDLLRGQRFTVQRCSDRGLAYQGKLCITNFPGRKEGRGTEASHKSKGSQHVCEARTLQNGGITHPSRSYPTKRLDDKIGSEGCLPSDTDSCRTPTPPPVPMGSQNLSISVSPIRVDICPTGIFKNNETHSGSTSAHGYPSSHLSRRSPNSASVNGGADSFDLPAVRSPGSSCQSKEIHSDSTAEYRVLGLPSGLWESKADLPNREIEEDTAISSTPPPPTKCFGERSSEVCREDLSLDTSYMASPSAFQSTTVSNQLSVLREPPHGNNECDQQVQHQLSLDQGGQGRSQVVVCSGQEGSNAIFSPTPDTDHDNRVGCLQPGVGSPTRRAPDGWTVVPSGNLSPHKLSRTAGSLSSSTVFCQAQQGDYHPNEIRQCHRGDIHQQVGGGALPGTVSASADDLGLVCAERSLSGSRTPTRERQHNSRSGIAINEGSLRLDAEPLGLPANTSANGSTTNRPICIPINQATAKFLQLETRSGSNRNGCIQPGLGSDKGIRKSPMVLDSTLPESDKTTKGKGGNNHPPLGITTVVPNNSGNAGGLPQDPTNEGRSGHTPNRSGIHNESRCTGVSGMAHIRESFTSRGISSDASALLLASWRPKTQSNYDSLFSKWSRWCLQRNRNPIEGPIEDVANFLADLFKEGYLYRSLNSYRSAISALHSKVDGYSIGQHPLITRMLKGVFNERPPVAKYSAFWDVSVVLRYLKGLGMNDTLSLRLLTIKLAMLMALTRPARSVDLSKLDIRARSFSVAGATFKAQHLSKQSRVSKPLADFFYPRYREDENICPVVTLQAYEARTLEFRAWSTQNRKTLLFLSWIGKHDPVTGSTIARWLKTCLTEAGINTEIFKAHSVRGASSSTAASAGVTTADILKTADWSSAGTFQKFYLRPSNDSDDKSSFGTAVLSSAKASNLHVDIETEPSEM